MVIAWHVLGFEGVFFFLFSGFSMVRFTDFENVSAFGFVQGFLGFKLKAALETAKNEGVEF